MKLRLSLFTLALVALPLFALAQSAQLVSISSPQQPPNGTALPSATVSAVAILLTAGNAPVTITSLTVAKVGSANDAAIVGLDIRDSATNTLATVGGFSGSQSMNIPLSLTLAAGEKKTLLVSATTASNLTPYSGQFFELNITGVGTGAIVSGNLPMFGAQYTLGSGVNKPTCNISANSTSFSVGQTINLSWTSTNATGGTITGLGSVSANGSQGILPGGSSATYVGTFSGPGGTGTCSVTLTRGGAGSTGGGVSDPGTVQQPTPTGSNVGTQGTLTNGSNPVTFDPLAQPTGGVSGSLIPCNGIDCRACDLAPLFQRIINYLVGLSIPLAAAMFAWAGILYFTSAANPGGIEKAKKVFMVVFVGVAVTIGGWLLIQTLLYVFLTPSTYQSWNTIQCPTTPRLTKVSPADWLNAILGRPNTNVPVSVSPNSVVTQGFNDLGGTGQVVYASGVSVNNVNPNLLSSINSAVSQSNSGQVIITSAERPGSITTSGNLSNHAVGEAVDIGYNNTAFNSYIAQNGTPQTTNYVASGQPAYSLNGYIWSYEPATQAGSTGNHWHVSATGK